MVHKVFFLAALVVVVSAEKHHTYDPPHPTYKAPHRSYDPPKGSYDDHDHGYPNYYFKWKVNDEYSRNHYGQEEAREGYDTDGSYFVILPNGVRQEVKYTVKGDSGFLADVSFHGDPHPSYHHEPYHHESYDDKPHPTYRPKPTYKPHPTYKPLYEE